MLVNKGLIDAVPSHKIPASVKKAYPGYLDIHHILSMYEARPHHII